SRGAANYYPSTINVSGVAGTVLHISVTLTAFNYFEVHGLTTGCSWGLIDVLLAGPGGQSSIAMSDVPRDTTDSASDARTLTFDDNAAAPLPNTGSFNNGTYQPTDYEPGDTFPSPAPPGPYGA